MSVDEKVPRSELVLQGISASQGIAFGQIFVYLQSDLELPEYQVEKPKWSAEITRFDVAVLRSFGLPRILPS